jgi:anti-sigma regulatory factor (Ser/Thr protein kinase)
MQQHYRHVAVPYEGQQFLSCCTDVAEQAAARDEQLTFLVSAAKAEALRDTLGNRPADVTYLDMDDHVRNPARLIALIDGFRAGAAGRRCVSVHEPTFDRTCADRAETWFGESVLNSPALQSWNLAVLCLYDTDLGDAALAEMHRTHPTVRGEDGNAAYEPGLAGTLFAEALPTVPTEAAGHDVRSRDLAPVREFVRSHGAELAADRREDLVLAANEVITNSVQHGGGACRVTMWDEPDSVVCDVQDTGHISDPLVGRLAPAADTPAGRGLWLANQLCDLVQIRSSPAGTTVRLRVDR